jgi:hypothetical protein
MPVFQVSSRKVQLSDPPKKRARRFPSQWYVVARVVVSGFIGGTFFTLLIILFGPNTVFIFLPVLVSLTWAQPQLYNINKFLASTPIYLLLTICLTFIYYGAITVAQLLIYQNPAYPLIIPVTSALAFAIILDPVRVYVQQRIERGFNLRERDKAIEAFTTTLREEIDLDQLRERFLTVIQRTMQPYSVSLWTLFPNALQQSSWREEISVADADPLIAYMLSHPGLLENRSSNRAGNLLTEKHLRSESREEKTLMSAISPLLLPRKRGG